MFTLHLHNEELKQSKANDLPKNSVYISSFIILLTEVSEYHLLVC